MIKDIAKNLNEVKEGAEIDLCNFALYLYVFNTHDPSVVWKNNLGIRIENPFKEVTKILLVSYGCEEFLGTPLMPLLQKNHPIVPLLNAMLMESEDAPVNGIYYQLFHETAYNQALDRFNQDRYTVLDMTFLQQAYAEENFAFATQLGFQIIRQRAARL